MPSVFSSTSNLLGMLEADQNEFVYTDESSNGMSDIKGWESIINFDADGSIFSNVQVVSDNYSNCYGDAHEFLMMSPVPNPLEKHDHPFKKSCNQRRDDVLKLTACHGTIMMINPSPKTEKDNVVRKSTTSTKNVVHEDTQIHEKAPSKKAQSKDISLYALKERNRLHARRSRQKKKATIVALKAYAKALGAENAQLRAQIQQSTTHKAAMIDSFIASRLALRQASADEFILGLKKPVNRVLDSNSVEFLQTFKNDVVPCLKETNSVSTIHFAPTT